MEESSDSGRPRGGGRDGPAFHLVSVIVPVRDGAAVLPEQLDALAAQTYTGAWEVIVADNGSQDGTAALACRWAGRFPSLRVEDASGRQGANHARNVGARSAKGDLLLFCDADDVVCPGWVAGLERAARSFDAVGGRMDQESLNDPITQAWRPPLARDGLPVSSCFLPYTRTANCAIRASVFEALGGFTERYRHGGDDVEFFWRLQLAGYSLGYAPEAVVKYRLRKGLWALVRQFFEFGRAAPLLYRDFHDSGLEPSGFREGFKVWRSLLKRAPRMLARRERRGVWMRMAAFRCGRIAGSIQHRIVYL